MNRIDRLFAITTLLQSRGRLRARDLAEVFEVSQRTIYRDLTALSESGVPLAALPGQGYELREGFFLPPLRLTAAEASALVLGARLIASSASRPLASAAHSAEAKVVALLDDDSRQRLREMSDAIDVSMLTTPGTRFDLDDERVLCLCRSILDRRLVTLRYFGRNRAETTVRQVEPRQLGYFNGVWYLAAYCRLREAERHFRLDRIEDFTIEAVRFRPRPASAAPPNPKVEVVVRFVEPATRWVEERQHWSFVSAVNGEGGLTATYRPDDLDEIASWILGWGTAAQVIAPPQLRQRLLSEARGLVQQLT